MTGRHGIPRSGGYYGAAWAWTVTRMCLGSLAFALAIAVTFPH